MPTYLMLSRLTPEGLRTIARDPDRLYAFRKEIEALDVKILQQYALTGQWDFVTMLEAPDNLAAFRVAMEREATGRVHTDIFPTIDLDLFSRLLGQTTEITGPFKMADEPLGASRAAIPALRYVDANRAELLQADGD
jgi:uncharacterized protein with GYD domain